MGRGGASTESPPRAPEPWRLAVGTGGSPRAAAVGQALFVTLLWSSSWVLIKVGLRDLALGPLSFAGLRYTLAAFVLLPLAWPALRAARVWGEDCRLLARVALLGLLLYAVTQGTQFVALGLLPAATVSLALTTSPVLVAVFGLRAPGERPTGLQALGIAGLVLGALLYFGSVLPEGPSALGLLVAAVGVVANALSAILGRSLAQRADRVGGVRGLTALSMGVGGLTLLAVGLLTEGPARLTPTTVAIIAWLAVGNTALAFALWNHTLKSLTAVESSVLNNTMLVQVAALAWLFLGEALDARQVAGLAVAAVGVLLVQAAPWLADAWRSGP